MSRWTEPSESDWLRWEALIWPETGDGLTPWDAARALGHPRIRGSGTFKRSDPVRHGEILERFRHDRDEGDRQTARETYREAITRALDPVPILHQGAATGFYQWDGATALRAAELLHKAAGGLTERVEVAHDPIEITVTHERRLTLADVAAFARTLPGLGDSPRGQLPAAGEVLATFDGSESAAGGVPARPEP